MAFEIREVPTERIEIREEDDKKRIEMYPAIFNSWSRDLGGFKERIIPGAFSETIEEDNIIAVFNHDKSMMLGRNTSGTLKLEEDERGLKAIIEPPESTWGEYVVELIERGDIEGGSFRFNAEDENWKNGEEIDKREIIKATLKDVGPVTWPAYTDTEVDVRSAKEVYKKAKKSLGGKGSGRYHSSLDMMRKKIELI